MHTEEDSHDAAYINEKEFQAVFMLDPDIEEEFKNQYSHLDKNLAITNLKQSRAEGINEPDEARNILRALHILNNKNYFFDEVFNIFTGKYIDVTLEDGSVIKRPVYEEKISIVSKFPKTYHSLKSQFISFVNTSASRQGHRIKAATTTRREKSETFEEKSNVSSPWGSGSSSGGHAGHHH